MNDLPEDLEALDVPCPKCGAEIGEPCKRRAPYEGIAHNFRAMDSDRKAKRPWRPTDAKIGELLGRDMRSWYAKGIG